MSRTFFNLAEIETEWLQSETVMDRLALIPGGMRRAGGGGGVIILKYMSIMCNLLHDLRSTPRDDYSNYFVHGYVCHVICEILIFFLFTP